LSRIHKTELPATARILGYTEGIRRVLLATKAHAPTIQSRRALLALSSIDEGAGQNPL